MSNNTHMLVAAHQSRRRFSFFEAGVITKSLVLGVLLLDSVQLKERPGAEQQP